MGFAYKTCWIAVRDCEPERVADALGLAGRVRMSFGAGTERAYHEGIYVCPAISGWTLAHSPRELALDAAEPEFPDRLRALSRVLGEVQFFGTHRVVEYHAWARAIDGELSRAYCYVGESDEVMLAIGSPSEPEREAHVGVVPPADTSCWGEEEWDIWFKTAPDEEKVLRIAGAWSINPAALDDRNIQDLGWHGFPGRPSPTGRWRRILRRIGGVATTA
ncbi:hypothetical protein [Actinoplanes ianthinogenes]|uniref:hypothetical protein n=1 Tax=Actinoplanes ianthinogenes TaxID=122358 RepID=UPI0016707066|nr:hypothetical protein [Actinoplanes ianthinogenes]